MAERNAVCALPATAPNPKMIECDISARSGRPFSAEFRSRPFLEYKIGCTTTICRGARWLVCFLGLLLSRCSACRWWQCLTTKHRAKREQADGRNRRIAEHRRIIKGGTRLGGKLCGGLTRSCAG